MENLHNKQAQIFKKFISILDWLNQKDNKDSDISKETGISKSVISRTRRNPNSKISNLRNHIVQLTESYSLIVQEIRDDNNEFLIDADGLYEYKIDFKEGINPEISKKKSKRFYIYYYLDAGFNFNKSLLELDFNSNFARLTTYRYSHGNYKAHFIYEGDILQNKEQDKFSILLNRMARGSKNRTNSIPSFCTFDEEIGTYRLGTFSSSGNASVCGKVLLEETEESDAKEKCKSDWMRPLAKYILDRSRLTSHSNNKLLSSFDSFSKGLKSIAGVYEGFSLVNREVGNSKCLQRLVLQIFDDGEVKFKSVGMEKETNGRVLDIRARNTNVIIYCPFENYGERETLYANVKIILNLELAKRKGYKDVIFGIHGGIEKSNEDPMAGRLALFKTSKKYESIQAEIKRIDEYCDESYVEENIKGRKLKEFFRGDIDPFVDRPKFIEKHPILQINKPNLSNLKTEEIRNSTEGQFLEDYIGFYYSFKRHVVHEFSVKISSDVINPPIIEFNGFFFSSPDEKYTGVATRENQLIYGSLKNTQNDCINVNLYIGRWGKPAPIISGIYVCIEDHLFSGELILIKKEKFNNEKMLLIQRYLFYQRKSIRVRANIYNNLDEIRIRNSYDINRVKHMIGNYRALHKNRQGNYIQSKFVLKENYQSFLSSIIADKEQICLPTINDFEGMQHLIVASYKNQGIECINIAIIRIPTSKRGFTYLKSAYATVGDGNGEYAGYIVFKKIEASYTLSIPFKVLSEKEIKESKDLQDHINELEELISNNEPKKHKNNTENPL